MRYAVKILSMLCMFLLPVAFVTGQSTGRSIATASIVNPVGLVGLANEEIQLAATSGAHYNIINNPGDPLIVFTKMQRLLQKNVESGNLLVSAADEDTYNITVPASVIFHSNGQGNYLKAALSFTDVGALNMPLKMQMEVYVEGAAVPGRYSSLPAEITVNFN